MQQNGAHAIYGLRETSLSKKNKSNPVIREKYLRVAHCFGYSSSWRDVSQSYAPMRVKNDHKYMK